MKKKIINGFLLVAMFVAATGTFVSCKDYDDENYASLQENASLYEAMNTQFNALKAQFAALETAQKNCSTACDTWKKNFEAQLAQYYTKSETYNKGEVDNLLTALQAQVNAISTAAATQEMLNTAVTGLKSDITGINGKITSIEEKIANIKFESDSILIDSLIQVINKVNQAATAAAARADEAYTLADQANTLAQNASALAAKANGTADAALALAKQDSIRIDGLKESVDGLKATILAWGPRLDKVETDAAAALAKATANETAIAALRTEYEAAIQQLKEKNTKQDARIDSLANELNQVKADALKYATKAELAKVDSTAKANFAEAKHLADSALAEIKLTNDKLGDLETAYKAADKNLQDQIDALSEKIESLTARVEANELKIKDLIGQVNSINNALAHLITGVIVQGTENPVTGYVALPADVRSTILAAYYGTATNVGVEFPSGAPRYYVDDTQVLSAKDLEMIGSVDKFTAGDGEVLMNDREGNAGTLYLTINPSSVDFSGAQFSLVNSVDEKCPVLLSTLAKSDKKLTFGYTRASSNGFYETKATLAKSDISKVKPNINVNDIKTSVKELIDKKTRVSLTNLATVLVQNMSGVLDAEGVKATWTDSLGEHSVLSQYSIAATAMKPLGYGFMYKSDYKVPGLGTIERLVGKVIDGVKINLPYFNIKNLPDAPIDTIELKELSDELAGKFMISIDTTVTTKDTTFVVPGTGDVITIKGQEMKIWVTRDLSDYIKEVYGETMKPIGSVNKEIIGEINTYLDDVRTIVEELRKANDVASNIEDAKTDIKNKLNGYIEQAYAKLNKFINSAYKALQPVMLVKTSTGFKRGSQSVSIPTTMNAGTTVLVPTSYTAELLAPAMKKFIAVTNVYNASNKSLNAKGGNAACKAALDAANASGNNIKKVVDGDDHDMLFSVDTQAGYIYEIVYTALDYNGKIVAKRFYIEAK